MNQRDMFFKWLFYSLATLLGLLIQALVLNRLDLWQGVHPFLPPILAICPAILEGREESTFFAVGLGLVLDLLIPTNFPAFYTISFVLLALLTKQIANRIIVPGFVCAFVCGALALVLTNLLRFVLVSAHGGADLTAVALLSLRELVLTLPLIPLYFWLCRKIYLRMRDL